MSGASIRAKIKSGLAKAIAATGSAGADLVYLISETNTGGNNPLNPAVIVETETLLLNAIFKNYEQNLIGGDIATGDRMLVTDNEVEIKTGDIIKQGSVRYIVISLGLSAPTSDVLAYFPQVRVQ